MTMTIRKLVIDGLEILVDSNEEELVRAAEQMEALERSESFDCAMTTVSSQAPTLGEPSRPLNPSAITLMDSVLRSSARPHAVRRDRDGDL